MIQTHHYRHQENHNKEHKEKSLIETDTGIWVYDDPSTCFVNKNLFFLRMNRHPLTRHLPFHSLTFSSLHPLHHHLNRSCVFKYEYGIFSWVNIQWTRTCMNEWIEWTKTGWSASTIIIIKDDSIASFHFLTLIRLQYSSHDNNSNQVNLTTIVMRSPFITILLVHLIQTHWYLNSSTIDILSHTKSFFCADFFLRQSTVCQNGSQRQREG